MHTVSYDSYLYVVLKLSPALVFSYMGTKDRFR